MYLWRDVIPQEALRHPFLLHGLLAMSAMSLAYLRPDETDKFVTVCDKHQTVALSGFRAVLSGPVTEDTANAAFALSSIISVLSMARAKATAAARPPPIYLRVEDVTEVFLLTRGVREVISLGVEHIKKGPLSQMFVT